jgi:hypothetical protein
MVDTINDLSDLAVKLNRNSDTLNTTISTLNKKLEKLNLGFEVWIAMDEGDPYFRDDDEEERFPRREERWLGYCKVHDHWELATKEVTTGVDYRGPEVLKHGDVSSLHQSPRKVRICAMKLIPALLNAIKSKAEHLLESIDLAEKAAEKL